MVIYSYTVQSGDVNFDIKVSPFNTMVYFQWIDFTVVIPTSINDFTDTKLSVYPNPTTNFLNITGENIKTIRIFDINGKLIISDTYNTSNVKLDVSYLTNGFYTLMVNDKPTKFIKN